jgi:hypothetical protein
MEIDEQAIAHTVVTPIRRQEPGHYAFYQMSARRHWATLTGWQRWLVRRLRAVSFTPVGANSTEQRADVGAMMAGLGVASAAEAEGFASEVARLERDLLFAQDQGLSAPPYVARAFRECYELAGNRHSTGTTAGRAVAGR